MRKRILAAAGGGGLALALAFPQGGALEASPQVPAQEDGGEGESPADYAGAAFAAWVEGDQEELEQRAQPAVAEFLSLRGPGTVDPIPDPACEGAAGSTYCTWLLAEENIQLQLRVVNQAASEGHPGAVVEAVFIPSPPGVAIWPLTTQEEADSTQQSVDEGHSPWMLDPEAVITSYASTELGWEEDIVDVELGEPEGGPVPYLVTNTSTGLVLNIEVDQPARSGDGGIWAVTWAGASQAFELPDDEHDDHGDGDGSPSPSAPAPAVPGDPGFTG